VAFFRFFAGLLFAVALQAAGTRLLPGLPQWVDLFLVVTVVAARHGHPEGGLFAGLAAGWAADALSGGPFGLFGFANSAVGYGAAYAAKNLVVARTGSIAALFALASAAQSILVVLLALSGLAGPALPSPVALAVKVASSALLGLGWIRLERALAGRLRRRRGRPSDAIQLP
jgi:rod shape-determining protein MreD